MFTIRLKRSVLASAALLLLGLSNTSMARDIGTPPGVEPAALQPTTAPAQPAAKAPEKEKPPLKQEELDQLLAPVALYPDSLISQILMASTYPVEVVEAERWVKKNGPPKTDAQAKELEKQSWDASVKSLCNFPDVLNMMSEKIDMTVKLGDAFLAQQKQVMDTVQTLRKKAQAQGNLKTTEQQKVSVNDDGGSQVIVIESSSPDVIYVPTYNPTVVYGTWPYPAYPPYYYYPPGYVAHPGLAFGVGVACGLAWGYAWGNCNWHGGDVNINVDRNVNRNRNIDRNRVNNDMKNRPGQGRGGQNSWQHDPSHRKGASYRDSATANQYGRGSSGTAAQSREAYRGRAEAGRQDISRGGADQFKGTGAANRPAGAANRPATTPANRAPSAGTSQSSNRGNAFSGASQSGNTARASSNRGSTSRASSGASRPSGGARGGGGRGGGGRR